MNASEIISKKVYSIYEGNEVGYVLNFSLDEKLSKLDFLVVVSLYEENEMILKTEDVSSINDEAVFIKSEKALFFDANADTNNPIGKKIFSTNGDAMGCVNDVELVKFSVKKIIGSCCEILPKHIFSSGKDCVFFSKNKAKKSKIIEKKHKIDVKIQEIAIPYKQRGQGVSLLGKTILKDVLDENHIVIFRKNTMVTPKILIEIKKRGLLKKIEENTI